MAVELDQYRLEACREAGVPVIYGDAAHPVVLEAGRAAHALLPHLPRPLHGHPRHRRARAPGALRPAQVVARAEGHDQMLELHEMGVAEVVNPQLEAGLEITRRTGPFRPCRLRRSNTSPDQVRLELGRAAGRTMAEDEALAMLPTKRNVKSEDFKIGCAGSRGFSKARGCHRSQPCITAAGFERRSPQSSLLHSSILHFNSGGFL
ncbi:MAG: hypothetical protein R2851_22200 [Caldilineaceae bacterium]